MKPYQPNALDELIRLLTTAAAHAALYHPQHPQVLRLGRRALACLEELLALSDPLTLKVVDGRLIHANQQVTETPAVSKFLDALARNGISYLGLTSGVTSEELLGLINVLSKSPERPRSVESTTHIQLGSLEVRQRSTSKETVPQNFSDVAACEAHHLDNLYQQVKDRRNPDLSGLRNIVSGFISAFNRQSDALLAMAPLRTMDEYTYTHSTNICLLNIAQARNLGIEGALLSDIGMAALLHDVGKMFIPPAILSKSGQLDPEEWRIMQQHPRLGAEYLLSVPGVPRLAVVTAFEHHMRYDGTGYPRTGHPWTQHLCSHMTAISDTYDAMRTHRAYEESLELDRIITIMLDLAGNKLHPQLTYSFLQMLSGLDRASAD